MTVKLYEVGGCVRDELMGTKSNDVDFAVEAESYETMRLYLVGMGFKIYIEKPEFLTIRAQVPTGHKLRERTKDADFVLCRKDGPSSDGRRPDYVEAGTIFDDLARRDFTVNAIARDEDGNLIDPYNGREDCLDKVLKFVGNPHDRILEDGLRILRGFRFIVTKGLRPDYYTNVALYCDVAKRLKGVSEERIREELNKMFAYDTIETLALLKGFPETMLRGIFKGKLRLDVTTKGVK
jgi:tRNA nucleotidyltransferase/poly(A) polymerase